MNVIQNDTQKKYKQKYKYLKLRVKGFIIENAAICDEVAKIQENIQYVKDERKFLLRKLLEYENDLDVAQTYSRNDAASIYNGSKPKPKKRRMYEEQGKVN
ncbi:unnamed protein product [Leptidea sinapis]|uniref:INO80 complex subunit E N-terminal domain-containing protein n=1 Tax=Leptidea sinapis TaxID=189913 RepID=A0A5E4PXJ0_9NEOP|nr:unnamed protein product [Leptidea sinapis]